MSVSCILKIHSILKFPEFISFNDIQTNEYMLKKTLKYEIFTSLT